MNTARMMEPNSNMTLKTEKQKLLIIHHLYGLKRKLKVIKKELKMEMTELLKNSYMMKRTE